MKHYAMIFHSARALTPEESQQRQVQIAAWAKQVEDTGISTRSAEFRATGSELIYTGRRGFLP